MDLRKPWNEEEDHLIRNLVKRHGTHRWSQISKRMSDHFGPPGRSGKQCRERWHNHLNPKINKMPWTDIQEQILFKTHHQHGNRWKRIAEELPGRTDNDIKNKFYSTMRKKLRKINKLLGKKNSTSSVKQIKPKVLSNIFAAENTENNPQLKEVGKKLSILLFNFDEKKSKNLKNQQRQSFLHIIEKISSLNSQYVGGKRMMGQSMSMENSGLIALPHIPQTRNRASSKKMQESQKLQKRRSVRNDNKEEVLKSEFNIHIPERNEMPNIFSSFNQGMNFEFNVDEILEKRSLGFRTPNLSQKKDSVFTPLGQKSFVNVEFMMQSPRMTRSFFRTPVGPTPNSLSIPSSLERRTSEMGKPETYDNILTKIQNQVRKQMAKR